MFSWTVSPFPKPFSCLLPQLARALLHVRVSEFSVAGEEDQHEDRRYRALVALLAHATAPVIAFLTSEVYSPHLDIHQRLLIMDVLQGQAT